ncbi:hypothetical protein HWV62_41960, partial [Athelia sp. TMB]
MDTDKIKIFGARVKVDGTGKLAELERAEKEKMKAKVEAIASHGINCFVNRQLIYNYPESLLAEKGIMVIEHADFEGVERLSLVTGGEITSTFERPDLVKLGQCDLIEEIMIGEDKLIKFSGVAAGEACTVVLRGSTNQMVDEAERSLHDALSVLSQTVKETRVVLGGGCSEMLMSCAVDEEVRRVKGKKAIAAEAFGRALRQIPTILADNAGYDSSDLVSKLRAAHYEGDAQAGLDMNQGTIGSMKELGITESYKLKRQVVLSASEAAEMIIRVDDILRATPRKREAYLSHISLDIRTSYILFIISFVDPDTPSIVKQTFLEQHRDVFLSLFKSIAQDPYPLLRRVLEVCWTGIWYDPKIKRTLKIGLFGESTIAQGLNVAKLIKLYDRVSTESAETEHIPADLVHHFLLAICTRPGVGICFKDRGWYPRETDGEDRAAHVEEGQSGSKTGRIYNKILSNVLKTLKVNDDMRQQELALKIMSACPELVAGYWTAAALTLEPRLSSKWIANVSFFGSVISLPVPSASFFLPGSELLHPSPPPLANILENTFPSVNTKHNLSKGLQSSSSLVQHCTALALARCLSKYAKVISAFEHVQNALDEDEEDGQWRKRRREVEREVRRRVPEFQVIVGFSQQKIAEGVQAINPVKLALLAESAQRLLWLYHRCLPSMAAEARFDVGKLLQGSFKPSAPISEDSASDYDASIRLGLVRELHVLRLLKESDQFAWSTKASSSQYSYLNILLKMFSATEVLATRLTITSLLKVVLSESILFQEDPEEVDLWLESLPTTRRAVNAESPDGAALTDEADSVVNFLDDCMQRCLKTPYRYIEERDSMATSALADEQLFSDHTATPCSPLLLVVLEQLGAKIAAELLSPSDLLALSMFVRLLVFKLSSKQHDTRFFSIMTDKFDSLLRDDLFAEYPNVINAIR